MGYGKSQILVINRVRVLRSGPHSPAQYYYSGSTSPGDFRQILEGTMPTLEAELVLVTGLIFMSSLF